MKSELPKQFMLLLDAPILMHTIERFAHAIPEINLILVLPEHEQATWTKLCRQMDFDIPHTIVNGGATRYDSVKNGLSACPNDGLVAIHDGVRPMVTEDLIQSCFTAAESFGSALPVVEIAQSLRKIEGESSRGISREGVVAVQTPQCFQLAVLKPCYLGEVQANFTDDATVFEAHGHTIHLVEGETTNLKITTQADLKIAEAILAMTRA